jgi:DNA repair exonuclease SbcCD ATPase subunit
MRLPIVTACLVWTALAASTAYAQSTSPAPATVPSATSETKYKSPDDAIMKFGHILGHVIADTDEKEASVKAGADAQTKVIKEKLDEISNGVDPEAANGKEVQKRMDDIDNGVDPDAARYMRDEPPVEAACPPGKVMPAAAAAACEARIAEINGQFAALKARHDNLQTQKNRIATDLANKNAELQAQENRIAIDTANKIAELDKKKAAATDAQSKIEACADNPDTMSKKACLDHLFDNTKFSPYDLDSSVVKPVYDSLGGHKSSATIIKSQNQVHDDGAIRKVMSKKTCVPSPGSVCPPAK